MNPDIKLEVVNKIKAAIDSFLTTFGISNDDLKIYNQYFLYLYLFYEF